MTKRRKRNGGERKMYHSEGRKEGRHGRVMVDKGCRAERVRG